MMRKALNHFTIYALLLPITASCVAVDTRSCSVLSDLSTRQALLEQLRPVVERPSKNGRTYSFDAVLALYDLIYKECEASYVITFEPITNPNPTTVFTGGVEQYIIYKNGGKVVGPLTER
jgi:hypothetical protein